jgi:glutathione peroxidase
MSLYDVPVRTLAGEETSLLEFKGQVLLIVNVASYCGFTPQYAGLQQLHDELGPQGFTVLGFPCNQFGEQEPGTAGEIREFCETSYGVGFPLFEKVDVKGPDQHPLYAILSQTADAEGQSGDVWWNFEKFLVDRDGTVAARIRTRTTPEEIRPAIEALL